MESSDKPDFAQRYVDTLKAMTPEEQARRRAMMIGDFRPKTIREAAIALMAAGQASESVVCESIGGEARVAVNFGSDLHAAQSFNRALRVLSQSVQDEWCDGTQPTRGS